MGDPLNKETELGPLAREDLAIKVEEQILKIIAEGGGLVTGGSRVGCFT